MARSFETLRAGMSPERRVEVEARTARMLADLPLHDVRRARRLSRESLASLLGRTPTSVAKLERHADLYVSTLRSFVEAMGGRLEIRARFPEGEVRITRFSEIGEDEGPGAGEAPIVE